MWQEASEAVCMSPILKGESNNRCISSTQMNYLYCKISLLRLFRILIFLEYEQKRPRERKGNKHEVRKEEENQARSVGSGEASKQGGQKQKKQSKQGNPAKKGEAEQAQASFGFLAAPSFLSARRRPPFLPSFLFPAPLSQRTFSQHDFYSSSSFPSPFLVVVPSPPRERRVKLGEGARGWVGGGKRGKRRRRAVRNGRKKDHAAFFLKNGQASSQKQAAAGEEKKEPGERRKKERGGKPAAFFFSCGTASFLFYLSSE